MHQITVDDDVKQMILETIEAGDAIITVIERKSTEFIQKLLHVGSGLNQKKDKK